MDTVESSERDLIAQARSTFRAYLSLRMDLRARGMSEAALAVIEASEHTAWDLTNVMWTEAVTRRAVT